MAAMDAHLAPDVEGWVYVFLMSACKDWAFSCRQLHQAAAAPHNTEVLQARKPLVCKQVV